MDQDYHLRYKTLRDEFRSFADGGCININKEMNDAAFNSNWPNPEGAEHDNLPISRSYSSKRTTPKSSNSSDSPEETDFVEQIVTKPWPTLAQDGIDFLQQQSTPVDQALAQPIDTLAGEVRPRKGHKKSRGGCYNCKKRKIKVRNKLIVALERQF
jgi:hypothetical protein